MELSDRDRMLLAFANLASGSTTRSDMPHVEVLFFDGCPNHEPLIDRVRALFDQHDRQTTIEPIRVDTEEDAQARRFLGSPTLRVNGADVEPGAEQRTDFGLKCRLYRSDQRLTGFPDSAWIRNALEAAGAERESARTEDPALARRRAGAGPAVSIRRSPDQEVG